MRYASLILWLVACGPTVAEIKQAKNATYTASPQEAYKLAEAVTAQSYPIAERMPDELIFATEPQWFSDHGRQSHDPDDVQRKAGNMQVSFVVLVTATDENRTKIAVSAKATDYEPGKRTPRELGPDDPKLPKWIADRADKLHVAIHKRLVAHSK